MTIHYLDGGPFETKTPSGSLALVLGYDDEAKLFVYAYPGDAFPLGFIAGKREACDFDPPPPIPAAARKPQLGEVWMHKNGKALFLFSPDANTAGAWYVMRPDATHSWCERYELTRPATPEEADPFRPIFEGLKRSLGEA